MKIAFLFRKISPSIIFPLIFILIIVLYIPVIQGTNSFQNVNKFMIDYREKWQVYYLSQVGSHMQEKEVFTNGKTFERPIFRPSDSTVLTGLAHFSPLLESELLVLQQLLNEFPTSLPQETAAELNIILNDIVKIEKGFDKIDNIIHDLSSSQLSTFVSLTLFHFLLTIILIFITTYQFWKFEKLEKQRLLEMEISTRTIKINEHERKKLARSLHDGLAQELALANMFVDQLPSGIAKTTLKETFSNSFEEIKVICHGLRSVDETDTDLSRGLKSTCIEFMEKYNLFIEIRISDELSVNWADEWYSQFYRIIHEALINIVRHSGSTTAEVNMNQLKSDLHIQISDKGKGMKDVNEGLGMKGIRERVDLLGGNAEWLTFPNGGTQLKLRLPRDKNKRGMRL